jgi:hypothetical protein
MLNRIVLVIFLMFPSFLVAKEADVLGGTLCFFFTRCEPEAPMPKAQPPVQASERSERDKQVVASSG